MDSIVIEAVSKVFRHRPALFNLLGKERSEATIALHDVSLAVGGGSVLALLGPNGSGKTTLLKLISTIFLPDAGRVLVHGYDSRSKPQKVRSCVGFAVAGERSFFPRLTARENLEFFAALDDVPSKLRHARIETMLERTRLLDSADTLVMKFSSGMYQKLGIARSLLKRPAVLLLDEPTRSLDPDITADIWNLVRELSDDGMTIVVATHNFQEAVTVADSVAVLENGTVAGYREVANATAQDLRSFYFDIAAEAAMHDLDTLIESCR